MIRIYVILIFSILLFLTFITKADPIRVAIIDTGIKREYLAKYKLCKKGHKDFTGTGLQDFHGHGTNVAGIINRYAEGNYCLVILKYTNGTNNPNIMSNFLKALAHAVINNYDIVSISSGGPKPDVTEKEIIQVGLKKKMVFIVAAGNESTNLDKTCNYFPACYFKNVIVVGNGDGKNVFTRSNYGSIVDLWEDGRNVTAGGITMSGTSQSTAIVTGKFITIVTRGISAK